MVRPRLRAARLLGLFGLVLAACGGPSSGGPPGSAAPPAYPPPARTPRPLWPAEQTTEAATQAAYLAPSPSASPAPAAPPPETPFIPFDPVIIIGLSQYPDTLFGIESQSTAATQVLAAVQPPCVTSLSYEYQPVCFAKLPSLADGDAFTRTVTVDASYPGSFVLRDELITDASALTQPVELEQLVATWTLIDGLTWEDGTPLTAKDFEFAAQLYNEPDIQNASRFVLERTETYAAPDDRTLVWTGVPGYADATYFLNYFGPEPEHVLGKMKPGAIGSSAYANQPLAYGPYKIVEHIPQASARLIANEHYWRAGAGLPKISEVIFSFVHDEELLLRLLEAKEIDAVGSIGLTEAHIFRLEELERAGAVDVSYAPATVWEHLDFAVRYPDGSPTPFAPAEARQAAAYAIDRQAIIDAALHGQGQPMRSFLPADHWAYPPGGAGLEPYEYDPAKARELLRGLGYVPNADGILERDGRPFAVQLATSDNHAMRKLVVEQIQRDLRAVGIDAQILYLPSGQIGRGVSATWFAELPVELRVYAWVSGPEPSTALYRCDQIPWAENNWSGQNYPRWCDPAYDRLALAAEAEPDRARRLPLLHAAQSRWSAELPALPLFQRLRIDAVRPELEGVRLDPTSFVDFWNIEEWTVRRP